MKKKECICPNTGCPVHGNCKACIAFHHGKPYCTSLETQKLVDGNLKKYGIMDK